MRAVIKHCLSITVIANWGDFAKTWWPIGEKFSWGWCGARNHQRTRLAIRSFYTATLTIFAQSNSKPVLLTSLG